MTVRGWAGPMAGVAVVFHDAAGAPVVTARTDGAGRAAGDIDSGGMITVLLDDEGQQVRATFMDVERGDELALLSPASRAAAVGTAYVTVAGYTGASQYVVRTPCRTVTTSSIGAPIAIAIDSRCMSPDGTLQVLVTAHNLGGGMIAAASARDVAWANPMNIVMPDWAPARTYVVEASAAPAGATGVVAGVAHVAGGVRIDGESDSREVIPGAGASFSLPYAPGFGELFQSHVSVQYGTGMGAVAAAVVGESTVVHQTAVPPASRAVDLSHDLLPRMSPPSYDRSVAGRPALTWTAQAALADTDGASGLFTWQEGEGQLQLWIVLAPPDVGSRVQLPALPDELASWAPTAFASMGVSAVVFVEADWLSSYRQLRREAGMDFVFDDQRSLLPPTGDAVLRMTVGGGRL